MAGHDVSAAADGNEALEKLRTCNFELVLCDIRLPGPDGFTLLQYARALDPSIDVILMTGHGCVADAVAAMKRHATDYIEKPFASAELLDMLGRIEQRREMEREREQPSVRERGAAARLIGHSAVMAHVRAQLAIAAHSDAPVLLTGESGTGKELAARALHDSGARRDQPMVAINCASFPETLLEAELFGHERGAFTGATRAREGLFAAAGAGTLFLDEIGEMPPVPQAKLLRVLQERKFSPLGTNASLPLRARVVSATNRPLPPLIKSRQFREDLYYRIKVFAIELPPLRERAGDLPVLVAFFLRRLCAPASLRLSPPAWNALADYPFPGNVRELEHALEHACALANASGAGEILVEHLPAELREHGEVGEEVARPFRSLGAAMKAYERGYLLRCLCLAGGNKTRTARLLGISRKTLWEKLRAHGITNADIAAELTAQRGQVLTGA